MDIRVVEQIVPSRVCFTCDVCCRFPERDSPLRPYFTREEIQAAIARGISPDAFPDHTGSKVEVVPQGEGYQCPAFQVETGRCGIYEDRPLDCRLYPVAVMWDRENADVVMGWDSKCPFIRDNLESTESRAYVERTAAFLESQEAVQVFISNQQLIGSFQDDVIVLRRLDRLTQGLRTVSQLGLTVARVSEPPLRPLALTDRPRFEAALAAHAVPGNPLAARSKPLYRPFRPDDSGACLDLFQQWRQGAKYNGVSDLAAHLAADAEHAHRHGITRAADLGLIGRVVEVEGRIAAYTFGYPLNATTFCILFEIADRNIKGLGAYIFREFCRELESYELIDTMDDSGLEGLRRAKLAYHPIRLVESYIVSPA